MWDYLIVFLFKFLLNLLTFFIQFWWFTLNNFDGIICVCLYLLFILFIILNNIFRRLSIYFCLERNNWRLFFDSLNILVFLSIRRVLVLIDLILFLFLKLLFLNFFILLYNLFPLPRLVYLFFFVHYILIRIRLIFNYFSITLIINILVCSWDLLLLI